MKFIIYSLILAVLGYFLQSFAPWWSIVILAGIIGALTSFTGIKSFFMGFVGGALLWGIYALVLNVQNDGILATRVGELFGGTSPLTLVFITALLGGFLGGMGALTGQFGRVLFKPTGR